MFLSNRLGNIGMKKSSKTVLSLIMYITRIGDRYHVAIDGNLIDIKDFGIDDKFKKICDSIECTVRDLLGEVPHQDYQESKL